MKFVELSSEDDISDNSSYIGVVDREILYVDPFAVIPPLIDFIEINDSFDGRKSCEGGIDGSGCPGMRITSRCM